MSYPEPRLPDLRDARYPRVRGLAPWKPYKPTLAWLEAVLAVLDADRAYWPLSIRYVWYRLIGTDVGGATVAKTRNTLEKVVTIFGRGRRAGLVPWAAVTDDGVVSAPFGGFDGEPSFWRSVEEAAAGYRRDLLADKALHVEVSCEAAGMVPRVAVTAHRYGVDVLSSGGFDSLSQKYAVARRVAGHAKARRPTVVFHIGDMDQSGHWLFNAVWFGGHEHRNGVDAWTVDGDRLVVETAELGVLVVRAIDPGDSWSVFDGVNGPMSAWEARRRGLR